MRPPELGGHATVDPSPADAAVASPAAAATTPSTDASVGAPVDPPGKQAAQAGRRTDCLARLRDAGWEAESAPQPSPGRADCSVDTPVRLSRLQANAAANGAILFPDRPVVACRFAETFGRWAGGIVAPVVAAEVKSELVALHTGPGTECRSRDRIAGAKLSAHAIGIAIDVAGVELRGRRVLPVAASLADPAWARAFATLRTAACGWFTTVLGPGSDAFHATHLHLDIQTHGASDRYRICQ